MLSLLVNQSNRFTYRFKVGNLYLGLKPVKGYIIKEVKNYFLVKKIKVVRTPIEFKTIQEIVELIRIQKPKSISFKGGTSSGIVKVYFDNGIYNTRTKGKLKLRNGHFKTDLGWLSEKLKELGFEDRSPQGWSVNK